MLYTAVLGIWTLDSFKARSAPKTSSISFLLCLVISFYYLFNVFGQVAILSLTTRWQVSDFLTTIQETQSVSIKFPYPAYFSLQQHWRYILVLVLLVSKTAWFVNNQDAFLSLKILILAQNALNYLTGPKKAFYFYGFKLNDFSIFSPLMT